MPDADEARESAEHDGKARGEGRAFGPIRRHHQEVERYARDEEDDLRNRNEKSFSQSNQQLSRKSADGREQVEEGRDGEDAVTVAIQGRNQSQQFTSEEKRQK